jgi:hypothetical protein
MKAIWNSRLAFTLAILVSFAPAAFSRNEGHVQPRGCWMDGGKMDKQGREGTMVRYLINPFGEIDGLFLDDGLLVGLPPHMSADVADLVKPGDAVALAGMPEGEFRFEACSITHIASDRTLLRRKPAWHGKVMPRELRMAELEELSVSGKIERVVTGKRGEPRIVVLENGANVRLPGKIPPGARFNTSFDIPVLHAGAQFAARGKGTETRYGSSLEASAISAGPASREPLIPSRSFH